MENRIKIGDVWYVKEDQHIEEIEMEVTAFDGRVFETDLYCFEASRTLKDDGFAYDDSCFIELSDKRVKPWKVEHLDNTKWFFGVLENNPESMEEAHELFCERGILEFRAFVRDLIRVGWLSKN
jgi:hypothetical protein